MGNDSIFFLFFDVNGASYVAIEPTQAAAYKNAKLGSNFDPQNHEENIHYYVAKLDELVKRFASIIPAPEQTLKL